MALGYTLRDNARVSKACEWLSSYLAPDWYVVGGHSIRYRLEQGEIRGPVRPFNGLDLVSPSLDPDVAEWFHIAHHHEGGYWSLIDAKYGLKINIFRPRHSNALEEVQLMPGLRARLQSTADQLVSVVEDLQGLKAGRSVDPKQLDDANGLRELITAADCEAAWRTRHFGAASFQDAYDQVLRLAAQRPDLLRSGLYTNLRHQARQLLPCNECLHEPGYPIAPKLQVAWAYRR